MPSVLFVCTANRSRSPIAAASFQKELANRGMADEWRVQSAGTWTTDGLPPAPEAVVSARRLGLVLAGHVSQVITPKLMQEADVVIVMERGQMEALQQEYAGARNKVHLLSEAALGMPYDVPDPVTPGLAAEIHTEIAELVHNGFDRICALVIQ
jgi:protein-tyrosine-phosphatase